MTDEPQYNGSHRHRDAAAAPTPRPAGKRFKSARDGRSTPAVSGGSTAEDAQPRVRAAGAHRKPAGSQGAHGVRLAHQARPEGRTAGSADQRPLSHNVIEPVRRRPARRERPQRPKAPMIVAALVAVVAVVGVLAFAGTKIYQAFFVSEEEVDTVEDGLEVYVTIESGSSGDEIAAVLSEAHVIDDYSDYYTAVKTLGADQSLQPGVYLFYTHQDPLEVVTQLMKGSNVDGYTITVSEGLTVEDTAAVVEEALGIDADEFLAQAVASNYVDDYAFLADAADDSLEGFLYPKTYIFTEEPTADGVIRKMLDQYETEVVSLDFDAAIAAIEETYGVEMTEYDILIMASIVEREGLTTDQRYNVASTFYNRLSIGMYLQSDATMMYVTGGEVTQADLKIESPYNTYLNAGLPPTPICCPSLESIEAAMDPADTDYLYFYITTEAEYFSETYDEHLAAIEAES